MSALTNPNFQRFYNVQHSLSLISEAKPLIKYTYPVEFYLWYTQNFRLFHLSTNINIRVQKNDLNVAYITCLIFYLNHGIVLIYFAVENDFWQC